MSREKQIEKAYENAREVYGAYGVDPEKILEKFDAIPISIPCWQGDDIGGFERGMGGASGGIMATGDYPGKPRTVEELRQDMEKCMEYLPGRLKFLSLKHQFQYFCISLFHSLFCHKSDTFHCFFYTVFDKALTWAEYVSILG